MATTYTFLNTLGTDSANAAGNWQSSAKPTTANLVGGDTINITCKSGSTNCNWDYDITIPNGVTVNITASGGYCTSFTVATGVTFTNNGIFNGYFANGATTLSFTLTGNWVQSNSSSGSYLVYVNEGVAKTTTVTLNGNVTASAGAFTAWKNTASSQTVTVNVGTSCTLSVSGTTNGFYLLTLGASGVTSTLNFNGSLTTASGTSGSVYMIDGYASANSGSTTVNWGVAGNASISAAGGSVRICSNSYGTTLNFGGTSSAAYAYTNTVSTTSGATFNVIYYPVGTTSANGWGTWTLTSSGTNSFLSLTSSIGPTINLKLGSSLSVTGKLQAVTGYVSTLTNSTWSIDGTWTLNTSSSSSIVGTTTSITTFTNCVVNIAGSYTQSAGGGLYVGYFYPGQTVTNTASITVTSGTYYLTTASGASYTYNGTVSMSAGTTFNFNAAVHAGTGTYSYATMSLSMSNYASPWLDAGGNKVVANYVTAQPLYIVAKNMAGHYVLLGTTQAAEAYNAANWANYALAMADANGVGIYDVAFPATVAPGNYLLSLYRRGQSTAIPGDAAPLVSTIFFWNGNSLSAGAQTLHSGTTQAGANTTITLSAAASATTNTYTRTMVQIVAGTGLGQSRTITAYNGSTKIATVEPAWTTNPDSTSEYQIIPLGNVTLATAQVECPVQRAVAQGTASGGSTSAIGVVGANVNQVSHVYDGNIIQITSGTGVGQSRRITLSGNLAFIVDPVWTTPPDATSTFQVVSNSIAADVISANNVSLGSAGSLPTVGPDGYVPTTQVVDKFTSMTSPVVAITPTEIILNGFVYGGNGCLVRVADWATMLVENRVAVSAVFDSDTGLTTMTLDEPLTGPLANNPNVQDVTVETFTAPGTAILSRAKPGDAMVLSQTGLDNILTTAPTGPATTFREMLVQLWRRFFKKATMTSAEVKTYADNGTTVITTQTLSDDGSTQTQGAST